MRSKHVTLPIIKNPCAELILPRMAGSNAVSSGTALIFTMKYLNQDPDIVKFHKKYKFSRAKWYIGDLFNSGHNMNTVREWCTANFGKQDKNPDAWSRWINNTNSLFRFRDEKDYVLFVLRWS